MTRPDRNPGQRPVLIPAPTEIRGIRRGCEFALAADAGRALPKPVGATEAYAWNKLRETLAQYGKRTGRKSGKRALSARDGPKRWLKFIRAGPDWSSSEEAYELGISEAGVRIAARTPRALLNVVQTLRQLLMQYGRALPWMEIRDAPAFEIRGVMHDVSRGKVPRRQTLLELVDTLSFFKINQFQLYIEHTFAFTNHPLPGRGHSPLTAADVRAIGERCEQCGIEFVPCLQSLGHMHHFLKHARYADLAESDFRGGWTVSPAVPETYALLEDLYGEFLPAFPDGKRFNICCDEPWDLGRGRSVPRVQRNGVGGVYVDHVKKARRLARAHGRNLLIWGDVVQNHPQILDEGPEMLPRDVTILHWGYETQAERARQTKALRRLGDSGREFWVCPGTSAWNSLFFRKANAADNLRWMAEAGRKAGAKGYLITDWGDNGHYNCLSYSMWPFAYGAECAWNAGRQPAQEADFDETFGRLMFGPESDAWIEALNLLGGLYLDFKVSVPNHSAERWLLTGPPPGEEDLLGVAPQIAPLVKAKLADLRKTERKATRAAALLEKAGARPGATELIRKEWLLGANLARHACRRAIWLKGKGKRGAGALLAKELEALTEEFRVLWLARNKKSDLAENLRTLERIIFEFRRKR